MTAVELHLGAGRSEDLPALRQQLAGRLAQDVVHVVVHVDPDADVELDVLRALHAAAEVLDARGGSLALRGAGERVRRRLAVHGLGSLLLATEPYPEPAAAPEPARTPAPAPARTPAPAHQGG